MRTFRRSTRQDGAPGTAREGRSLAKGPALIVGTILVAFGLCGLVVNSDFPSTSSQFPDGTAQGETFLGIEVNGWTSWGSILAGALLLYGLARNWLARTMSLVVGLALAVAAVIALIDGEDVLGLAATNGWTKVGLGAAGAVLLLTALLPHTGRRRARERDAHAVVDRDPDRDTPVVERDEAAPEPTGRFRRDEAPTEVHPGDPLQRR